MLKLVRFLLFHLDRLLYTQFSFFHRLVLYAAEKIYNLLSRNTQSKGSKVAKILLPFATHYRRYYGGFSSYHDLRKILLANLMQEVYLGHLDSPGVEFEIYAYSGLKKNKESMLKVLKGQVAKEDSERIKNLKNIFYKKKVLLMGPGKIISSIKLENFDLIALANNKNIYHPDIKPVEDSRFVIFVNIGYFNRNKDRFLNTAERVAAIFIKPMIDDSVFPKFVTADGLLYNDYGPTGVQNILYSIFLGEAESIYVIGITGFLGDVVHRPGIKTYSNNKQHYTNNIRIHEPISNFCFVKNFVDLGLCSGDENFLKVYNNDVYGYCKSLDKSYPGYIYKRIDHSKLHSN